MGHVELSGILGHLAHGHGIGIIENRELEADDSARSRREGLAAEFEVLFLAAEGEPVDAAELERIAVALLYVGDGHPRLVGGIVDHRFLMVTGSIVKTSLSMSAVT